MNLSDFINSNICIEAEQSDHLRILEICSKQAIETKTLELIFKTI